MKHGLSRVTTIVVALLIIASLCLSCAAPATPAPAAPTTSAPAATTTAAPIKIKVSLWNGKAVTLGLAAQWWADEVVKRTNGKLVPELYFDQQLAKATETFAITKAGGVDVGGIVAAYSPKDLPLNQPFTDAFNWIDARERAWISARIYDRVPQLRDEWTKNNLIMLTQPTLPPYALWSTKPITKPEDLKGIRVRTWGAEFPKRYTAFGGVPATILMPEAYEGMQKGTVDACPLPYGDALSTGLHEVSKYAVNMPLYNAIGNTLFMNKDTWNKLPADIQKTLNEINLDSGPAYVKLVEKNEGAAKAAIVAKGKVQISDWSEADQARWHTMLLDILHTYLTTYMPTVNMAKEGDLLWTELNKLRTEYAAFAKTSDGATWLKQFN